MRGRCLEWKSRLRQRDAAARTRTRPPHHSTPYGMARPAAAERRAAKGKAAGPAATPPARADALTLAICWTALPLALAACAFGLFGVFVLRDPDEAQWYSQNAAAELWRTAVQKNPFYLTIAVNGGAVTAVMVGKILWEHGRAVQLERKLQRLKQKWDEKAAAATEAKKGK
eukprot:scaffold5.g726.t1